MKFSKEQKKECIDKLFKEHKIWPRTKAAIYLTNKLDDGTTTWT